MIFHYLELLKNFIVELSWPIVTLIILFNFKTQIKYFLQNIKLFKALGGEIETHVPNQKNAEPLDKESKYLKNNNVDIDSKNPLNDFQTDTINITRDIVIKQTNLNDIKNSDDKVNALLEYSILIILEKHFQFIYNYIYGSQIELIERIKTNDYETKESLQSLYDNAIAKNPNTYQSYSFGQYLAWLHNNGLLTVTENNNVIITYQGIDFLTYIEKRNLTKIKPIY